MSDFTHQRLHPASWKSPKGYANAVIARGPTIYLGGQIGWNGDQEFESDDLADQVEQTLANIVTILKEADAGPEHLVRLTWYVKNKQDYLARLVDIGAAYKRTLGRHFPAMALVQVSDLVEDRALVEIEATAVLPE